jgi:hypothetical protein
MPSDWARALQQLPRWAIAFLAAVIAGMLLYATIFARCTVEVFGLSFGPKVTCSEPDGVALLPVGSVIAWDPIVRRADGAPTGETRPIPAGWRICDGHDGTPNLGDRFLMGVLTTNGAGSPGGSNILPPAGQHSHGGTATNLLYRQGEINWERGQGHLDEFSHHHAISTDGGHDHGGDNRPAFYTVLFLCREP